MSAASFRRRSVVPALAAAVAVLAGVPAWALHKESPGAIRITSGNAHQVSATRSWGRYVAFTSENDLLGNGSSGRQVFLFSHFNYVCQLGTPVPSTEGICPTPSQPYLLQITTGVGDPANPSVTQRNDGHIIVAFDAYGSFSGASGPAAAHRQIYVLDLQAGTTRQLTASTDDDNTKASLSGGGGVVTFESASAFVTGFAAGIAQVVAVDLQQASLPRWVLTGGQAPSTNPMLNTTGERITFESSADLLGDRSDTGVSQIFWAEIDRNNPPAFTLHQFTAGDAMSRRPYIAEQGGQIVFESTATNLPGGTPGPGIQIYTASTSVGDFPTVTRHTDAATFGDCTWPAFDIDASRIAMICTGDPLANGTTGNRVFVIDLQAVLPNQPTLYQLTRGPYDPDGTGPRGVEPFEVQGPVGNSLGNFFVTVATNDDLTGTGNCDHQVHVIDYFGGKWFPATQQQQVPPGVPAGPADEGCDDGNACTTDTCTTATRTCTWTPAANPCDDHDACTANDACQAGVCVGGAPVSCSDGNVCTTDSCHPVSGCGHAFNTNPCDDANLCTDNDACKTGTCAGTPRACEDGNLCNGTSTCNPANGLCGPGTTLDCDDGNPCTDDVCDPQAGCGHLDNTAACDDGNACTANDVCRNGACGGSTGVCDDSDDCTTDTCSPDGGCSHTPVPDFQVCQLTETYQGIQDVANTVRASPAAQLGGTVRQRRLTKRLQRAQSRVGIALTAGGKRLQRALKLVDKELKLVLRDLDAGLAAGTMDATLGGTLRAAVDRLASRVTQARAVRS